MIRFLIFAIGVLIFSESALSQEPTPDDSCAGYVDGAVMRSGGPELNGESYLLRCSGGSWMEISSSTVPPSPANCPNIGDVCDDGSVYAGLSPDGNVPMYTTPADASGLPWNNGNTSGVVNLYTATTLSPTVGEASTESFIGVDSDSGTGGVQPFQAPEYCYNLDAHGYQDWYVPARDEFFVLYDNQASIGGFGGRYYWTSTEIESDAMVYVDLDNRSTGSGMKRFGNIVRCVRT